MASLGEQDGTMPPEHVEQRLRASAAETPADIVARIERLGRRIETPCGDGSMVWHIWGKGAPLVLLHGGYGSWTHWLRNIETLSESYTVIAPDMPGLGESATPPQPHTAEALAAILCRGLDQIVPAPTAIAMAGFSFGSVMGGHVAAQMGKRIACFLMIGAAGLGLPRPPLANLQRVEPGMSADAIATLQRGNLAKLMFGDPSRIDALAVHLQNENTRRSRLDSRPIAFTDTLIHTLPRATARLGAIWGEKDSTCVPYIEQKFGVLRGIRPDVYCDIVSDAGHWVQWEQGPAFEARLRKFTEGRS
jgi:2-hydroxy-6-oxonona-2,4-dienedioate hydrolase